MRSPQRSADQAACTSHTPEPTAALLDSRTLRFSPKSGERAGYDEAKRKKNAKLHMAVDTLGHMLALYVTPADADDRALAGRHGRWKRMRRR